MLPRSTLRDVGELAQLVDLRKIQLGGDGHHEGVADFGQVQFVDFCESRLGAWVIKKLSGRGVQRLTH